MRGRLWGQNFLTLSMSVGFCLGLITGTLSGNLEKGLAIFLVTGFIIGKALELKAWLSKSRNKGFISMQFTGTLTRHSPLKSMGHATIIFAFCALFEIYLAGTSEPDWLRISSVSLLAFLAFSLLGFFSPEGGKKSSSYIA